MLTFEEIDSVLSYTPETGVLNWRKNGKAAGCKKKTGYIVIKVGIKYLAAHRVACLLMTGFWPINDIDHKDTTRDNNRWDNLRQATKSQNSANRSVRCASGKKGCSWSKRKTKWRVVITKNGVPKHLGYFSDLDEAHSAYCAAAIAIHGEYAYLK